MENIIKDNRLVSNYTFAKRFLSFVESVNIADACGYDEKESMLNIAKGLLKYQCKTAEDENEIAYLKRVGVYEEYTKPFLTTQDGVEIDEYEDNRFFWSCMDKPKIGEQVLQYSLNQVKRSKVNANRLYFIKKENCLDYIDLHVPRYSKKDLLDLKNNERD